MSSFVSMYMPVPLSATFLAFIILQHSEAIRGEPEQHQIRFAGQCIAGIAEHAPNTTPVSATALLHMIFVRTLVPTGGSILYL
jgi:hypothetical protein